MAGLNINRGAAGRPHIERGAAGSHASVTAARRGPKGDTGDAGLSSGPLSDASVAAVIPSTATKAALDATYGLKPTNAARAVGQGEIIVNVTDYGADPTGAADSSTAIRAAIAAGTVITFPLAGTFLVSRDASNAWAISVGAGKRLISEGATIKLANTTAIGVSVLRPLGNGVTIKGLTIDGNKANQSVEAQKQRHGVYIDQVTDTTVADCTFTNLAGDGVLTWRDTDRTTIKGCTITGSARNGISLVGAMDTVLITGNRVWSVAAQPLDSEPDSGSIKNATVTDNYFVAPTGEYSMACAGHSAAQNTNWLVRGNILKGAVYVIRVDDLNIHGNDIDGSVSTSHPTIDLLYQCNRVSIMGNTLKAISANYAIKAIYTGSEAITRLKINSNQITVATGRGIRADGVSQLEVSDNTIVCAAGVGIEAQFTQNVDVTKIINNVIWGVTNGILITPTSTFVCKFTNISGNYIDDAVTTPTYGIRLVSPSTGYTTVTFWNNSVASASTSAISLSPAVQTALGLVKYFEGNGTPESAVTAPIGSIYSRKDGGASTTLYVKQSGTGSTGWGAK